jgi:hypothetical protein
MEFSRWEQTATGGNHRGVRGKSHVGVELPNEAGEMVVLEVPRQQVALEGVRVPDHEAAAAGAPGDDGVGRRVGDHVVDLGEKRRDVRWLRHDHDRRRFLPRGWGTNITEHLVRGGGGGGGGRLRRLLLGAHGDDAKGKSLRIRMV